MLTILSLGISLMVQWLRIWGRDTGSTPGVGRFHRPRGNQACAPLLGLSSRQCRLQLLSPACPRPRALQGEACAWRLESSPHPPQLDKACMQQPRPSTAKNKVKKKTNNESSNPWTWYLSPSIYRIGFNFPQHFLEWILAARAILCYTYLKIFYHWCHCTFFKLHFFSIVLFQVYKFVSWKTDYIIGFDFLWDTIMPSIDTSIRKWKEDGIICIFSPPDLTALTCLTMLNRSSERNNQEIASSWS